MLKMKSGMIELLLIYSLLTHQTRTKYNADSFFDRAALVMELVFLVYVFCLFEIVS